MHVGVLALQGGYAAHIRVLETLGHTTQEVRTAEHLGQIEGLVFPGGESTTHLKLIERFQLEPALHQFVQSDNPVLATCAGLILCSRTVQNPSQMSFGWLDITVHRNGWGRQLDSFEGFDDNKELPLCFIRAPRIQSTGAQVKVLATLNDEPVLVQQGNIYGATFHPELTEDLSIHRMVFGEA